ncbi:MAG: hypothetical protein AB9856_06405 [Cellulosilyticaceae bacterium]
MNVCTRIAKIFELLGSLDIVERSRLTPKAFTRNTKMPLKDILKIYPYKERENINCEAL